MSAVDGFAGTVGIGLREVTVEDSRNYCHNKTYFNNTFLTLTQQPWNFSSDVDIRLFSSGCYYLDKETLEWTNEGVEILPDTNITHAHCQSFHLTEFAGGFITLPAAIDFNQVFANADFLKNPTIYATVMAMGVLYIIIGICVYRCDRRDKRKVGLTVLDNQHFCNKYYYEIKIFTGARKNASTKSNV